MEPASRLQLLKGTSSAPALASTTPKVVFFPTADLGKRDFPKFSEGCPNGNNCPPTSKYPFACWESTPDQTVRQLVYKQGHSYRYQFPNIPTEERDWQGASLHTVKGRNPIRTTVQKPWFLIRFPVSRIPRNVMVSTMFS